MKYSSVDDKVCRLLGTSSSHATTPSSVVDATGVVDVVDVVGAGVVDAVVVVRVLMASKSSSA